MPRSAVQDIAMAHLGRWSDFQIDSLLITSPRAGAPRESILISIGDRLTLADETAVVLVGREVQGFFWLPLPTRRARAVAVNSVEELGTSPDGDDLAAGAAVEKQ